MFEWALVPWNWMERKELSVYLQQQQMSGRKEVWDVNTIRGGCCHFPLCIISAIECDIWGFMTSAGEVLVMRLSWLSIPVVVESSWVGIIIYLPLTTPLRWMRNLLEVIVWVRLASALSSNLPTSLLQTNNNSLDNVQSEHFVFLHSYVRVPHRSAIKHEQFHLRI